MKRKFLNYADVIYCGVGKSAVAGNGAGDSIIVIYMSMTDSQEGVMCPVWEEPPVPGESGILESIPRLSRRRHVAAENK